MSGSGRLVLVTGASRGIGAATARAFGARGDRLILLARSEGDLQKVAEEVEKAGGEAWPYPVDLSDPDAVKEVCAHIRDEVGIPDILINNAGLGRWLFVEETPAEEALQMIQLPYLAAFWMCAQWLPGMIERGSGRIINVNSPASDLVWGGAAGYTGSRWALRGLSESLKVDLRGTGVRVCHAVFGEVSSNYWEANPGARDRLPWVSRLLPVFEPEQVARKLVWLGGNRRQEYTYPWLVRTFRFFRRMSPGLVRWVLAAGSYRRDS